MELVSGSILAKVDDSLRDTIKQERQAWFRKLANSGFVH
jgi:hypothetical protein